MNKKLSYIQYWRGIAAIMVIFAHTTTAIYNGGIQNGYRLEDLGTLGVYIFFIISGFIMMKTTHKKTWSPQEAKKFLIHRINRVIPPYWFWTTALLALWLAGLALKSHHFDMGKILSSYLLLPHIGEDGRINPILSQGWTLIYEIFFYCLFAVCIFFGKKSHILLTLSFCFLISYLIGKWLPADTGASILLTNPILLYFLAGMVIFFLSEQLTLKKGFLLSGMVLVLYLICRLFQPAWLPVVFYICPIFIVLFSACSLEGWTSRALMLIGDASYSIYLAHGFVTMTLSMLMKKLSVSDINQTAVIILTTLVSLAVGMIAYRVVEKPLTALIPSKRAVKA
ncbi:hypothetical protein AU490_01825 [Lonsdalea populi]|uniref:Acyltransferase n=1 Tax=Lonsdalea populi TaxID=1172565 RepID=A0A3N0USJ2_9GAMM|nr:MULTISPECIES: acyltransferase [Lonsdalea]OSN02098.1 hypothetical protein AU499_02745 [Lonsdalea populi]QPQ23167.1 acyltransferase [Lonsdalea populi]RAT15006.1 hypothetical protein AU486_11345 [Lonsdalea quercina]RAT30344.1 hypothetical protein AU490_01825 [Lonsdalea populi]RAT36987.1 hypothetical protein AU491_05880 [Lonsdalea populi]